MPMFGLRSPTPHPAAMVGLRLDLATLMARAPSACDYHAALKLGDEAPDALGNDTAPDCVEAGYLRQVQMREANAMGSSWKPSAIEAMGLLMAWGDPTLGTNLADAQARAAKDGISVGGTDLDVPLPVVLPNGSATLNGATWFFGAVGLCWALPAYLLANGPPMVWDVAPPGATDAATAPGDRHYTPSGAYGPTERRIVTWGLDVPVTPAFEARYLVGAETQLSRRWFDAKGLTLPGFDWAASDAIRLQFA